MRYIENAMQSLERAKRFVEEGVEQILVSTLDEEHGVSVCPGATALASLALAVLGKDYETARIRGTSWLIRHRGDKGWGKIPCGEYDEEVTRLAQMTVQLNRGGILAKLSVLEQARQLSDLVLTLGADVVPGLEGPTLQDIALPHILEARVLKKLPPYGRPVVVAACLLAENLLTPGIKEAIHFLRRTQMADGSWAEDVVVTALGLLALARFNGNEEWVQRAGRWLVRKQYASGGWPAFDQLQTWAMGWMGAVYRDMDRTAAEDKRLQRVQSWLVQAGNQDGTYGTTPPYTHPDFDDTAVALMALPVTRAKKNLSLERIIELQNEDGSWGTFPEFTGVPPQIQACAPAYIQSLDVTVHILEAMSRHGLFLRHPAALKGFKWLLSQQKKDGEFHAVWFEGPIYATAQALELMSDVHLGFSQWPLNRQVAQARQKTIRYLLAGQNEDGGWGTSVVETALALAALSMQGRQIPDEVLQKGIKHLIACQTENGAFLPQYRGIYAKGWNYEEPISTTLTAIRALDRYLRVCGGSRPKKLFKSF